MDSLIRSVYEGIGAHGSDALPGRLVDRLIQYRKLKEKLHTTYADNQEALDSSKQIVAFRATRLTETELEDLSERHETVV